MKNATDPLPQHKRSLWRGALISPWVVPVGLALVMGLIGLITAIFGTDPDPGLQWRVCLGIMFLIVMFGVPFTYLVTFAFVVPVVLLLRKWHALSAARLCLWCIVVGPVTMYAYASLMKGQPEKILEPLGLTLAASYGLISGAAFCKLSGVRLFARRVHRPSA